MPHDETNLFYMGRLMEALVDLGCTDFDRMRDGFRFNSEEYAPRHELYVWDFTDKGFKLNVGWLEEGEMQHVDLQFKNVDQLIKHLKEAPEKGIR